jgi:thiol:disulfide interchange protein DsbD
MLHFKTLMAFPMFATVVWLVWVLGQQAGIDAVAKVLLALVSLGLLVWLLGLPFTRAGAARAGKAVGAAALVAVLAWSWPASLAPEPASQAAGAAGAKPGDAVAALWQPYDEAALAQRIAQGQPVFIDFTAAWCVSCQVNKRLVLHTDATMRAFEQANVALMRADWTRRDDTITQALTRLGRNGVPVYALIAPGRAPVLLPEILTERIVRDALAALPAPPRS